MTRYTIPVEILPHRSSSEADLAGGRHLETLLGSAAEFDLEPAVLSCAAAGVIASVVIGGVEDMARDLREQESID